MELNAFDKSSNCSVATRFFTLTSLIIPRMVRISEVVSYIIEKLRIINLSSYSRDMPL